MKERQLYSVKKKIDSYKMLSMMDHTGHFIFLWIALDRNDREVFTSSHCTYLKVIIFLMINGCPHMMPLMVMVSSVAHTRILEMTWLKFDTIWNSEKYDRVLKTATKELVFGSQS